MVQGSYSELQSSDLDMVSLLRRDEEQEQLSPFADPEKLSLQSLWTNDSHSSHCFLNCPLPPESTYTEHLPVCIFTKEIEHCYFYKIVLFYLQFFKNVINFHRPPCIVLSLFL